MRAGKLSLLLLLVVLPIRLLAQACPSGTPPGSPMCLPPGAPGNPYTNQVPSPPPPKPVSAWRLTWGAIAFSTTGEIGAITEQPSRRRAQKAALERCASWGGRDCEIQIAYQNQCAVVAWPSIVGGGAVALSAASIEEASQHALSRCKEHGGGECKIVYTGCAIPTLITK